MCHVLWEAFHALCIVSFNAYDSEMIIHSTNMKYLLCVDILQNAGHIRLVQK